VVPSPKKHQEATDIVEIGDKLDEEVFYIKKVQSL